MECTSTATELSEATRVRDGWFGRCKHEPQCANRNGCIATIIRQGRRDL